MNYTQEELDARAIDLPPAKIDLAPGKSVFHGVSWNRCRLRWQVRLNVGDRQYFIGEFRRYYPDGERRGELRAARAYDNARWWLQDFCRNKPKFNFAEDSPGALLPSVDLARRELLHLKAPRYPDKCAGDFIAPGGLQ